MMRRHFKSILILGIISAFFLLLAPSQEIPDRDEMHSILSAQGIQGNRNEAFISLCDSLYPAGTWQTAMRSLNRLAPLTITKLQFQNDIHPPLYFMLLHIVYRLSDNVLFTGYIFQLVLVLLFILILTIWQKKTAFQVIILMGLLPGLFLPFAEVRHYGLTLIWAALAVWLLEKLKAHWSYKYFILFLIVVAGGTLTHYLFTAWIVSLLLSASFTWNKKRNLLLLILGFLLIDALLILSIPDFRTQIIHLSSLDTGFTGVFHNRFINLLYSIAGLFFPVWSSKLMGYGLIQILLLLPALGWVLYCNWGITKNFTKHAFLITGSFIFIGGYTLFYLGGEMPIHAGGVKYLALACIGFVPFMFDLITTIKRPILLSSLFWVIFYTTEFTSRLRDRTEIKEICQADQTFYARSADVFSTLRFISSMPPEKKIYVHHKGDENISIFNQIWWPTTTTISDSLMQALSVNYNINPLYVRGYAIEGIFFSKK